VKAAIVFCFLVPCAAPAQNQAQNPSQNQAGVLSQWEVRRLLQNLEEQAQHLAPIVEQIQPAGWAAQGAPQAYQDQWVHTKAGLQDLLSDSAALQKKPERLTLALDTYFRMVALENVLGSVLEGVRKYQDAALARRIQDVINENSANRDTLRQYVQDLSVQKEQEFAVADEEAQRCRGALMHETNPAKKKKD
jgi:hypothetical protein